MQGLKLFEPISHVNMVKFFSISKLCYVFSTFQIKYEFGKDCNKILRRVLGIQ